MAAEHAGLRRRVVALLRREIAPTPPDDPSRGPGVSDAESLEARIERLERLVEALQDEVYRNAVLQDQRDQAIHRKTEPAEIARALHADQRRRGI